MQQGSDPRVQSGALFGVRCGWRRGRLSRMTVDESQTHTSTTDDDVRAADLRAADVAWDIDTILPDGATPSDLFDRADALADELTKAVIKREKRGSTGFGHGVAALHGAEGGAPLGRADRAARSQK